MMSSIAVLRRNGLGDLLCAYPLLMWCRQRFPQARITLFLEERNAPLMPYLPADWKCVTISTGNKYLRTVQAAWSQRKQAYDIAIAARPEPMRLNNVFLGALPAKEKIAVVNPACWSRLFVNRPLMAKDLKGEHQALKLLQIVAPELDAIPAHFLPRLRCPFERMAPYRAALDKLFPPGDPVLFLSVSNNRASNLLSHDGILRVLEEVRRRRPFRAAISCLPGQTEAAHALAARLGPAARVWPSPSLDALIALLVRSDATFIGGGGNMHLAAALQKPQVVLLGVTPLNKWRPLSDKAICLHDVCDVNRIPLNAMVEALVHQLSALHRP